MYVAEGMNAGSGEWNGVGQMGWVQHDGCGESRKRERVEHRTFVESSEQSDSIVSCWFMNSQLIMGVHSMVILQGWDVISARSGRSLGWWRTNSSYITVLCSNNLFSVQEVVAC
jgi:hypothetical protein